MKCPCENCLIVGRCRRLLPDNVVKKCDLVCEYLHMESGYPRTISYIISNLVDKELRRRLARITECLSLVENGGNYIGSSASQETIEDGKMQYYKNIE